MRAIKEKVTAVDTQMEELGEINKKVNNFKNYDSADDLEYRNMIQIDPPFQRESIWNKKYQTQLISSLVMGWPIPAVILYEEPDGLFVVFDGKQRLTTINLFLDSKIPIKDLILPLHLQNKKFKDLDKETRAKIIKTKIPVIRMTMNQKDRDILFDRINNNTSKLSAGEIRRGALHDEPTFQQLIEYLKSDFLPAPLRKSDRLYNEDLVCKILVLSIDPVNGLHKIKNKATDIFKKVNMQEIVNDFIEKNTYVCKNFSFEKFTKAKLWISMGILCSFSLDKIKLYRKELEELMDKFKQESPEDIGTAIHSSSYQPELARQLKSDMENIFSVKKDARQFDKKTRDIILNSSKAIQCEICECKVNAHNLQLDHIIPWSQGGKTDLSNMAILCADCNLRKTDKNLKDFKA